MTALHVNQYIALTLSVIMETTAGVLVTVPLRLNIAVKNAALFGSIFVSFMALDYALSGISFSVAYPVWASAGLAFTAVICAAFKAKGLVKAGALGIFLIIAGVMVILFS